MSKKPHYVLVVQNAIHAPTPKPMIQKEGKQDG